MSKLNSLGTPIYKLKATHNNSVSEKQDSTEDMVLLSQLHL